MKSPASYGLGWAKSSLATKGCSRGTLWRLFRPNAQRESIAPVDRTALAEAPSASVHRELSLIGHHQLRNEHSHNWISRLHVDHSGIGRDSRLARAILVILVHRGALLRCSMRAIYSNHRTQPRQGLSDFLGMQGAMKPKLKIRDKTSILRLGGWPMAQMAHLRRSCPLCL